MVGVGCEDLGAQICGKKRLWRWEYWGCRERKRELGRKYLSCFCLHEWGRLVMIECKGMGLSSISPCDSR